MQRGARALVNLDRETHGKSSRAVAVGKTDGARPKGQGTERSVDWRRTKAG